MTDISNTSPRLSELDRQLLPARRVWERYGIADRTLDRWLTRSALEFPKPIVVNKRRYWHEDELIAWERGRRTTP